MMTANVWHSYVHLYMHLHMLRDYFATLCFCATHKCTYYKRERKANVVNVLADSMLLGV